MNLSHLIRRVWSEMQHAPLASYRSIVGAPGLYLPSNGIRLEAEWLFVSRYVDGRVKARELGSNLIVNEQLDALLDEVWRNQAQATAWYCGLTTGTTTPVATDTMASHAWTEWQTYSEGARQTWSPGAASSQSITNSTAMTFTSSGASQDVDGAFITDNSTKGQNTGRLSNVKALAATKTLDTSETLDVTVTVSASSS